MQVDIAQLSWSKNTNTLSAEASELYQGDGNRIPDHIRVVGTKATFTFRNPVATRDADNDVVLWVYTSPLTNIRVVVFND